jgi:uncharacterized protein YcbK (DUF882 family)
MTQLSKNFTLRELIKSDTATRKGINNAPPQSVIDNLKYLCENLLQPIRDMVGIVTINSGYRSPALNKAVGGAKNSQHLTGQAVDFESVQYSNIELGKMIEESGLVFDQLIYEFVSKKNPRAGWIHISLVKDGTNRKQVLWVA